MKITVYTFYIPNYRKNVCVYLYLTFCRASSLHVKNYLHSHFDSRYLFLLLY